MSEDKTVQEKLQEETEQEEHEHHHNPTAAAMTNHIVANIATLHVKLHQYHWYVKGPHFFSLHEKFEELYDENEEWFDQIAERLLASGNKPFSTTAQFQQYSFLKEDPADKYLSPETMVENLIDDYRTTRDVTMRAITMAQDEGDVVLEDTLISYKAYVDKILWMLQAFLGKEAYEGDDAMEEDED